MSVNASQRVDAVAEQVAAMLAKILARRSVRPDDDFFSLGGDSLSATELMVAIEARYGVVIDPIEVFEQPKIRQFARMIADTIADLSATDTH
jgi:acyl carrier protein